MWEKSREKLTELKENGRERGPYIMVECNEMYENKPPVFIIIIYKKFILICFVLCTIVQLKINFEIKKKSYCLWITCMRMNIVQAPTLIALSKG
jgi:hypothetical protein